MITRREALALGLAGAGAACTSGCARVAEQFATKAPGRKGPIGKSELALVDRLTFGATDDELALAQRLGREPYVDELLAASRPEDARLRLLLHRLDALRIEGMELRDMPAKAMVRQFQSAALLRAVYGANPLLERMADLWINHFNIDSTKGQGAYLLAHDTDGIIRRHALGSFHDLLKGSMRSPAMLSYLDAPRNQKGRPNENYARELLELHSLGVHGGYTQTDVMEVARCFTGWTVENRFLRRHGSLRFQPELHDDGAKIVLGTRIPGGGGKEDADAVARIVAHHRSTASRVAGKLCHEFLGTAETPWRDRLAKIYLDSGGDLKKMLRLLLLSDDLAASKPIVKRPLDFVASALRATNANTDGGSSLLEHLDKLGQPLHQWPMPDGFPIDAASWSGTVLGRWNFSLELSQGSISGTRIEEDPALVPPVLLAKANNDLKAALRGKDPIDGIALCLASPEFQWR